jgi:myosin-crossreactive antigen
MNSKLSLKEVKKISKISKIFEKCFFKSIFVQHLSKTVFYENWDLKVKTDRGIIRFIPFIYLLLINVNFSFDCKNSSFSANFANRILKFYRIVFR